jgi:hypothetical protein
VIPNVVEIEANDISSIAKLSGVRVRRTGQGMKKEIWGGQGLQSKRA